MAIGDTIQNLFHNKDQIERIAVALERMAVGMEGDAVFYGARWDGGTSPSLIRTGNAADMVVVPRVGATVTQNDFNTVAPYSGIYLCNLDNEGKIAARIGEPRFSKTGVVTGYSYKVPVMVRIPKFYYQVVFTPPGREWRISGVQLPEFAVHPAFVRPDGTEVSEIFLGTYLAGTETVNSTVMLTSASGQDANVFQSRDYFRQRARARGAGWRQMDFVSYNAMTMLYAIEFAPLDSQKALGGSISDYRYDAADTATVATTSGNTFICLSTTASNFDVGQEIGIGTSRGDASIALFRRITAKATYDASNTKITFEGAAVNVAVGNVIWTCAQRSGRADALNGASGCECRKMSVRISRLRGYGRQRLHLHRWLQHKSL